MSLVLKEFIETFEAQGVRQSITSTPKNVIGFVKHQSLSITEYLNNLRVVVIDEALTQIEPDVIKNDHPDYQKYLDEITHSSEQGNVRLSKLAAEEKIRRDGGIDKMAFGLFTCETIDLPFKTVFIEASSSAPVQFNFSLSPDKEQCLSQNRTGILIHEISPENYMVFSLVKSLVHERNTGEVTNPSPITLSFLLASGIKPTDTYIEWTMITPEHIKKSHVSRLIYTQIKSIFDKIRTKPVEYGSENVNYRFRVGKGKNRQASKIKSVVHVRLKRKIHNNYLPGRDVDWSHRWEVRGHWRRIQGIGKDREGNYNIKGFTWVSAHEKGPEEKDLVRKIRLVS